MIQRTVNRGTGEITVPVFPLQAVILAATALGYRRWLHRGFHSAICWAYHAYWQRVSALRVLGHWAPRCSSTAVPVFLPAPSQSKLYERTDR